MSSLRQKILDQQPNSEVIENCPRLGKIVVVELWADELLTLEDQKKGKNEVEKMALNLVASVRDPDTGEKPFTVDDLPHLRSWPMLSAVGEVYNRLHGLARTEDAVKNSEAGHCAGSCSSCAEFLAKLKETCCAGRDASQPQS